MPDKLWSYIFDEDLEIHSLKAHLMIIDLSDYSEEEDCRYVACNQKHRESWCHCVDETEDVGFTEADKCKKCLKIEAKYEM